MGRSVGTGRPGRVGTAGSVGRDWVGSGRRSLGSERQDLGRAGRAFFFILLVCVWYRNCGDRCLRTAYTYNRIPPSRRFPVPSLYPAPWPYSTA